jgi:hypothetical protein
MIPMEPEMTSDHPFRKTLWPQFIKKRPQCLEDKPFQPRIGGLAIIPCPEKASISKDTGPFFRAHRLVAISGIPTGKNGPGDPGPGSPGKRSGMRSTEPIFASDHPFRESLWPQFIKKWPQCSGNRPFQLRISLEVPPACPEMASFSNDARPFPENKVQGDDPGSASGMTGASPRGIAIGKKCEDGICHE